MLNQLFSINASISTVHREYILGGLEIFLKSLKILAHMSDKFNINNDIRRTVVRGLI